MHNEDAPFFTVTIPVYNVEKWLSFCVESVLSQSFNDYEIVLVNDGSTDSSLSICEEYAERYKEKIRVINQHNQGLLRARRTGIKAANGLVLVFLDSDDALRPDALKIIHDAFVDNDVDLVMYGFSRDPSFSDMESDGFKGLNGFLPRRVILQKVCDPSAPNALCLKAVRRSIVDGSESYPSWKGVSYAEDLMQLLSIADKAQAAYYIPQPLYYYRVNQSSITRCKYSSIQDAGREMAYSRLRDYAAKWAQEFQDDSFVTLAASKWLDSCAQVVQVASESLDRAEYVMTMHHIVSNRDFSSCCQTVHSLEDVRIDRRIVIKLLNKGRYGLVRRIGRAKRLLRILLRRK